jgi:hypothetical protein
VNWIKIGFWFKRFNGLQEPLPYLLFKFQYITLISYMNNFFRALIAGYGAKKLGGGCLGTVVVFVIIWVALGQCQ